MKNMTCGRPGIERRDLADSHTYKCVTFQCVYFLEFYTAGCSVPATSRTLCHLVAIPPQRLRSVTPRALSSQRSHSLTLHHEKSGRNQMQLTYLTV